MPATEDQYWEQEYVDFERSICIEHAFWRAPAHLLQGTPLFAVFERLCVTFPDHPDDHNTVFYLFDHTSVTPKMCSVLLRCSHFEHSSLNDLRALTEFLEFAADIITTDRCALVELLDGCTEKLHVRFHGPRDEIISILRKHASRKAAK
ncbi:MAG: hypothetical protein HOP33_16490 [Verrucomicrobia bacterium]|nr:hypothetical protein [Verrucomicrobiota bacterium]